MRSAPIILLLLGAMFLYGMVLAVLNGTFGLEEVGYGLWLPGILIVSAIKIWRIQRSERNGE